MTKQEHIDYWKNTASKDWVAAKQLFAGKSYVQALFWAHLVLEKLLKAHWVKDNIDNHPPKIHNLITLAEKTKLQLSDEEKKFFYTVNQFQLEGRYSDYLQDIYKKYNWRKQKLYLTK